MSNTQRDKRNTERIRIPEATVVFRQRNRIGLFERFSRPMKLYNLTKSGLCFRSEKRIHPGSSLYVEIIIPGEKKLRMIGDVKWIDERMADDTCLIGAQFTAFGKGRNYNSIRSLERLRKLQEKYG
jgi:hypothetical protein